MHSDFLIPPVDQYDYRLGEDPEWEDKLYDKVVWRGSTTGADLNVEHHRRFSQRVRLCRCKPLLLPPPPPLSPNQLARRKSLLIVKSWGTS
jgi:hypothetical protein